MRFYGPLEIILLDCLKRYKPFKRHFCVWVDAVNQELNRAAAQNSRTAESKENALAH